MNLLQTLESDYRELRSIVFPTFKGRQKYMHSFDSRDPFMPFELDDYTPVVTDLLNAAGVRDREVHVTVDEKIVQPGMSQRRPGPHIDGCFMKSQGHWSGGGDGSWNHNCNRIPGRMSIIVAASVAGCRAWRGRFHGNPQNDGDCSHFVGGPSEVLPANVGYLLSPDCIHESMVFDTPTPRQFLRIAFLP